MTVRVATRSATSSSCCARYFEFGLTLVLHKSSCHLTTPCSRFPKAQTVQDEWPEVWNDDEREDDEREDDGDDWMGEY